MLDKNLQLDFKYRSKCLSLFLLINKNFWKSIIGPIFSILIPFIFTLVWYSIALANNQPYFFINMFSGIIIFTIFPLCFFSLAATNLEFRKSIFLRKLKNEGLSKIKYLSTLIGYYLMIIFGFCFLNTCIFFLFCTNQTEYKYTNEITGGITETLTFKDEMSQINVLSLIVSFFLTIFQCISFALLISIVINNPITIQFIGFGLMILTLTLGGQIVPLVHWPQITFFRYLTLFNPIGYPFNLMNISIILTPNSEMNNIFNFSINVEAINKQILIDNYIVYFAWEKPLLLFGTILFSSLFCYLNIKYFKWTRR